MLDVDHEAYRFLCTVVPEREAARVVPSGELDLATAGRVQEHLDELLDAGFRHVVLDLRELTFLDSTGLRLILDASADAGSRGVRFTVVPGPPEIQRIFELTATTELVFGEQLSSAG